ncbi:MAG TPA: BREX-1 system adenine-specific DNA-methyltransferase PglX, partial [Clostridiaceae bacterium]|nr:BREX-1 system adenine-specific DNA-methyltransferase PglX [Clostridiaceae bacterium]
MDKGIIEKFAVWARTKLISDISYRAGLIGITRKEIRAPLLHSTPNLEFYDVGTTQYVELSGVAIKQRHMLVAQIERRAEATEYAEAFDSVVEEVAYTWFNRLIALRFMEVNDYLPSHVRVLSSTDPNKREPDIVTFPFETDLEFSETEREQVIHLKEVNELDALYRLLFLKQCNQLHGMLPYLFEPTADYSELLLPISCTDPNGVVYRLVNDINEAYFDVKQGGQIQIIGWLYQFYNAQYKEQVFADLKKNIKINKDRLPAATQLFTPEWIVRYMVENSLGRLWLEGHPDPALQSKWCYFMTEAEQPKEVNIELSALCEDYSKMAPQDIKVMDPCMGSGHILVYAFDLLMDIYVNQGYTKRDATRLILKHNLYGLDVDQRAYQLAYFAVMMKARQYDRRIFSTSIEPHLYAIKESHGLTDEMIDFFAQADAEMEHDLKALSLLFENAREFGSLIHIEPVDFVAIERRIIQLQARTQVMENSYVLTQIVPLVEQARVMCDQYDVVITNPPYLGHRGMGEKLS